LAPTGPWMPASGGITAPATARHSGNNAVSRLSARLMALSEAGQKGPEAPSSAGKRERALRSRVSSISLPPIRQLVRPRNS
jgi:hypothetical protein